MNLHFRNIDKTKVWMMDQELVDESIDYHGTDLVDCLAEEQVDVQLPSFLTLTQKASKSKEEPR